MIALISGGCKNGKSFYAQRLACQMALHQERPLYYLATMIPADEEDLARIRRHRLERAGWGFDTVEQGYDLCSCLEPGRLTASGQPVRPEGVFLLDSTTALLSNEMFQPDGQMDRQAAQRVAGQLLNFARQVGGVVFVSDNIYSDPRRLDPSTQCYRKGLALIDRKLAQICDQVIEVTYGLNYFYKGTEYL